MLRPLELSVTPSCTDCLSWSVDGELALAGGEFVHVLTPKINSEVSDENQFNWKFGRDQWYTTKFRVNIFSDEDWPIGFPRPVQNFSIGAEQSISTVAALQWSPPGLARHGRCILAVLTTNLILSMWEPVGRQNKWTRVSIVNHAMHDYFDWSVGDAELRRQKQMIRSFSWSPACKITGSGEAADPGTNHPGHGSWGYCFLATANDDNDIVFLQVKKIQREAAVPFLAVDAIAYLGLESLDAPYPNIQTDTLLARSFNAKRWMSHISWGPWVYETPNNKYTPKAARSVVAAIQRSNVRFIDLEVSNTHEQGEKRTQKMHGNCRLDCYEERQAFQRPGPEGSEITGPLLWTYTKGYGSIALTVAFLGALITMNFPDGSYGSYKSANTETSSWSREIAMEISKNPLFENTSLMGPEDKERALSWDPITGMASTPEVDETGSGLHVATVFSHAQSLHIPKAPIVGDVDVENGIDDTHKTPHWYSQIAEFRDRYDLDYDLGGSAIARAWGLATHRGWIAVCFTLHPGDMIEYSTATDERITIIFSPAEHLGHTDPGVTLPWAIPNLDSDKVKVSHRKVLHFILSLDYTKYFRNAWERKLLYAAACCAIVASRDDELLSLSKCALTYLVREIGPDLTEEISKCDATYSLADGERSRIAISPKSAAQLQETGAELFEVCEICGSGIEWYSGEESQCSEGHQFVRCGLTFLSIQGPDGSKFCSLCGAEYLEEELLAETILHSHEGGNISHIIFDTFNTCIYCGAKFRS